MKTAYQIAADVRAGAAIDPAVLAAALDELEPQKWSDERYQASRMIKHALFASASREGLYRAVAELVPMRLPATIRAVLLDEGDPLSELFPENPWGIGPKATLVGALDHVWDLFDAPALTQALLERVQALVLLEIEGSPHLGYVHIHDLSSYDVDKAWAGKPRPPHDRRYAHRWPPFGDISMFTGAAPSEATTGKSCAVPAPLQLLYRRHAGLRDGMWHLSGPDDILLWQSMLDETFAKPVATADKDEQIRSDELVAFFSYGDDRSDLFDIRDPDEPVVRAWGDGHLYEGAGEPFLEWLESKTSLIMGIAED